MARRILVSGASGLIGTALRSALAARGDQVVRLVRRPPSGADEIRWDPTAGHVDVGQVEPVDAVVNLSGAPVGRRWTPRYKRELLESRVHTTRTLVQHLDRLGERVPLINASAVGVYGSDRGEEELTEASDPGHTFLADVVKAWELEACAAQDGGRRVALARTGLVLTSDGGALGPLLPLARLGLGGPIGSGRQWWPWISMEDEVRALLHLVDEDVHGPVNLVSPGSARQVEVARALGRALHRPAVVPTPAAALRLALGELADDVLGSQLVRPAVLEQTGFVWRHARLEDAVRQVASPWHDLTVRP
ncbi:TIGR01777 family oxidoreductase [uncultured Arsenicicoccus sp.]|uniref:TIGR01777 family oxidoreductase n=1 Tax=uncultured Arsenicicoccus sp. TaxID=491339 RepID=UPI002591D205|nr:TIGR01777 family oxidoreductase [uncultured Arsenicicoccus sp.]